MTQGSLAFAEKHKFIPPQTSGPNTLNKALLGMKLKELNHFASHLI